MENLTFYRNLPGVKKQAPKAIGATTPDKKKITLNVKVFPSIKIMLIFVYYYKQTKLLKMATVKGILKDDRTFGKINWSNVPTKEPIMGITTKYTEMYKAFLEAKKTIEARSEYFSLTDTIITDCRLFAELIKSHLPDVKIEDWGNNGNYQITRNR